MVKKRVPGTQQTKLTEADIEAFANAADGGQQTTQTNELDPNATRTYKSIRLPFNEYEFKKLEELAAKTNRSRSNAIRWAIINALEDK